MTRDELLSGLKEVVRVTENWASNLDNKHILNTEDEELEDVFNNTCKDLIESVGDVMYEWGGDVSILAE